MALGEPGSHSALDSIEPELRDQCRIPADGLIELQDQLCLSQISITGSDQIWCGDGAPGADTVQIAVDEWGDQPGHLGIALGRIVASPGRLNAQGGHHCQAR